MLIAISLKNIEKMFFLLLNVHMLALKWGQRSSSAIIGAFLQSVPFFLWSNNKMFLNSKKGRSLSEGLNQHVYYQRNPFGNILLWILQIQTSLVLCNYDRNSPSFGIN